MSLQQIILIVSLNIAYLVAEEIRAGRNKRRLRCQIELRQVDARMRKDHWLISKVTVKQWPKPKMTAEWIRSDNFIDKEGAVRVVAVFD